MKNRKYYMIAIIMLLIFTAGCNSDNRSKNTLEEDIRTMRNTTYDDVVEIVSIDIYDFMDEHDYYKVTNLQFKEDKLAVDDQDQVKKFNNISINLNIEVDSEKTPIEFKEDMSFLNKERAFVEFMSDENRELLITLQEKHPIEYSKVGNAEALYIDNKNTPKLKYSSNTGILMDSETITALNDNEPEEEDLILKKYLIISKKM